MDKTLAKELELVEAVKKHLEDGKMARTFEVPDDDDAQIWFKGYNLLTAKPTIYAANVARGMILQMTEHRIRTLRKSERWRKKKAQKYS